MDLYLFRDTYSCPVTRDVRFRVKTLAMALGQPAGARTPPAALELMLAAGAKLLPHKARVNDGGPSLKRLVLSVPIHDWEHFIGRLSGLAEIVRKDDNAPLTMEQRMQRVEALLRIGQ